MPGRMREWGHGRDYRYHAPDQNPKFPSTRGRREVMGWLTVMQNTNAWTRRPDGAHWDGMEYWDPAVPT